MEIKLQLIIKKKSKIKKHKGPELSNISYLASWNITSMLKKYVKYQPNLGMGVNTPLFLISNSRLKFGLNERQISENVTI